jgi:hypothetical protein
VGGGPLPAGRPAGPASGSGATGLPIFLLPYFSENRRFRKDNVDGLLGPYAPDWGAIIPTLLAYAAERGFLHRTDRTVHARLSRRPE